MQLVRSKLDLPQAWPSSLPCEIQHFRDELRPLIVKGVFVA